MQELTELLHRAYSQLAQLGLRYVATYQDAETTRRRCERGECYVAEADCRIVGTITFIDAARTSGCPYYDRPGVASFGQFGVEPSLQRRGIGTLLVRKAEERASATGAAELALDTAEPARDLIGWYERLGYRIVDHAQWSVTNYRTVIMSKTLQSLNT